MSKNWTEYVVGQDCTHSQVVNAMLKSKAKSVFLDKWNTLALQLEIDNAKVKKWRKDLLLDKIENIQPLLQEIIEEWTATIQHPRSPTLMDLIEALKRAGLNDMANETRKTFEHTVDNQQERGKYATATIEALPSLKKQSTPQMIPVGELDFFRNETPFNVQVTRPAKPMKNTDDFYKLPCRFKGYALIINIIKFLHPKNNRDGASNDTKYMKDLWHQLGYEPVVYEGQYNANDVEEIVTEFIAKLDDDKDEVKSCVVFIGSHGKFGEIVMSDGVAINVYQNFIYRIATCEALKGKPKLFVIQACQEFTPRTNQDNIQEMEMPVDDTIACFSTIPGEFSNRDSLLGSWYVYVLTRVVMKNAHQMDLEGMINQVQEAMRYIIAEKGIKGQLPTHQPMGLKKLYFNMKP